MELYFLSIVDGVRQAAGVGMLLFFVAGGIIASLAADSCAREAEFGFAVWPKRLWLAAGACLLIPALVPSQDALIRAYLMTKGRELVTAENVKALGARVEQIVKEIAK